MNDKVKLQGSLQRIVAWPVYLLFFLVIVNGAVYYFDITAGVVTSLGLAIYALMILAIQLYFRPKVLNDIICFANQYDGMNQEILRDIPVPYLVSDYEGGIIWVNNEFEKMTGNEGKCPGNISILFPELAKGKYPQDEPVEYYVTYAKRIYRVVMRKAKAEHLFQKTNLVIPNDNYEGIVTMCFYDETELRTYMKQCEDDKMVVALMYIDNYEEALESVEEVRRSLLTALIDRKITRFFANYDGLVRKIEKDKYFMVLKHSALETLKEQRFSILEEVKNVNIGNEMAVTLSIGIGLNAANNIQNYEYSRTAMEMALGRGGDQVVIKDDKTITYFGGKSQQVEKATRVKARVKAQALSEIISGKDRVVVMGHKLTDVDSLGAAIGIYRICMTLGKAVHIVVNDPTTSIKPLMAGYLDNPEYDARMFIDSAEAKELVDQNTVVVVVDTNKPSYTECPELLKMTKSIVVLDHHRRGNEAIDGAVLSYVEPYASSACELVAEILQYFSDEIKLRNIEADCLYAGILIDTNNFATRAGVRTFEAAAYLRRCGVDLTRVRKMLRDDINSYKARAEAIRTSEIYRNSFAIAKCPSEGVSSPTVVGAQAANELLNMEGVKASFVLTTYRDEVYISARAIDEINVQLLMEKMGGGGHINAAGAQSQGSMGEAMDMLKKVIDDYCEKGD
ncbi:MAG: DHH family phosphoesterase [Blautia sp.]|nr:DHH family phosphoesterase [Blautia sp.]